MFKVELESDQLRSGYHCEDQPVDVFREASGLSSRLSKEELEVSACDASEARLAMSTRHLVKCGLNSIDSVGLRGTFRRDSS